MTASNGYLPINYGSGTLAWNTVTNFIVEGVGRYAIPINITSPVTVRIRRADKSLTLNTVNTYYLAESWFDPNVGNVVNAAADMAATDYKNLRYTNTDEANQYGVKAWTADGTDESTLVSETYDYSAQPFPMGLTAGSMFLNLNTAGATLSRQLGDYDDTTHEFTAGASFESDPLHLKNVTDNSRKGGAIQLPRGKIDLPELVRALCEINYTGVCSLEYERDFTDNVVPVAECIGYFRGLMDSVR